MQLTSALIFGNACDDEEDNLATLGSSNTDGRLLILSRYPDEDEVGLMIEDESEALRDIKVTLSATRLLIETAPGATELFGGDDVLEIDIASALGDDLEEIEAVLKVLLKGVGTLVVQHSAS
ncbi:hypothetical protein [Pseudomonas putida]|uniref:Uncharacterized protein n=1 Tax=Pseudomonas putida TaxID=303 RepID=A0A177SL42_PSEPU|nr:hypothetical protein [Pseudomonas putida]OAI91264.1 hypothetical protein AYO28_22180 [Pseudomonas putida]